MLKRTIVLTNPGYLSCTRNQLVFEMRESQNQQTAPLEDLSIVVVENLQVTISSTLLSECAAKNIAVVICDDKHMPVSMMQNLAIHSRQTAIYHAQLESSPVLKKQLWKQTIVQKIKNQAQVLKLLERKYLDLIQLSDKVLNDDSDNREGVAARLYWQRLFPDYNFTREPEGFYPNNLLNYGYAILRAATARALCGSGLLPTLGIHHRNQYDPFCLADDIMEPYRPFIDLKVVDITYKYPGETSMSKEIKAELLSVLTCDVQFPKYLRPLLLGLTETTASLSNCFQGSIRKLSYPSVK